MYTDRIRELHPGRRLSTPEEAWSRGRHDVGVHFSIAKNVIKNRIQKKKIAKEKKTLAKNVIKNRIQKKKNCKRKKDTCNQKIYVLIKTRNTSKSLA